MSPSVRLPRRVWQLADVDSALGIEHEVFKMGRGEQVFYRDVPSDAVESLSRRLAATADRLHSEGHYKQAADVREAERRMTREAGR